MQYKIQILTIMTKLRQFGHGFVVCSINLMLATTKDTLILEAHSLE